MNKLIIKEGSLYFEGFEHLTDYITFAFYPRGIVIFNGKKEEKDYYWGCSYPDTHIISNQEVCTRLKQYNISDTSYFIWSGDSYIESVPSSQKNNHQD